MLRIKRHNERQSVVYDIETDILVIRNHVEHLERNGADQSYTLEILKRCADINELARSLI